MARFVVLVALVVCGCAPAPATWDATPDPSVDREAIRAASERIFAAVATGDPDALMAEYGDDAILMGTGAPMIQGKPAITTAIAGLLGSVTFQDVEGTVTDVTVSGDLGIETGTYGWTIVPAGGSPMPDQGKYVHVWGRTPDGAWKVIRYVVNSDLPPQ